MSFIVSCDCGLPFVFSCINTSHGVIVTFWEREELLLSLGFGNFQVHTLSLIAFQFSLKACIYVCLFQVPNFFHDSFEDSTVLCTDNGTKQILGLGEKENGVGDEGRKRRTAMDVNPHTLANDDSCKSGHISIMSVGSISSCVSFECSAHCTNSEKSFWILNGKCIFWENTLVKHM